MKMLMQLHQRRCSNWSLFLLPLLLLLTQCHKNMDQHDLSGFKQVNLVANNNKYHSTHVDPTLINAWGLAFSPNGIAWVNAADGHISEVYDKEGVILRPPVNIPSPNAPTGGSPTGIVFNSATNSDFTLSNNQKAAFLFVGEDGVISGWNQAAGNNALRIKDNSANANYKGLAIGKNSKGQDLLYAANFTTGKIDVWDASFNSMVLSFTDPGIPTGYAPFNIKNIDGQLFVAYAKVGVGGDEAKGLGNGYVSIFTTDGELVKRFASQGMLNAPWGLAKASADFFPSGNDNGMSNDSSMGYGHHSSRQPAILVGNFGDGKINVYSLDGSFMGQLKTKDNKVITIDGLWALSFAPATATAVDPNRLYFTAGPDDESDGLFGYLVKE
jgi:uncharacterized protein (TIGR03118 family)